MDTEKAFDLLQHIFLILTLKKKILAILFRGLKAFWLLIYLVV